MLDIAAPKVAVPATVFMIVSSMEATRTYAPLLVPIITWIVIKFALKLSLTNADIITVALVTTLLSFPVPVEKSIEIVGKGIIFLFLFSYLRIAVPEYY